MQGRESLFSLKKKSAYPYLLTEILGICQKWHEQTFCFAVHIVTRTSVPSSTIAEQSFGKKIVRIGPEKKIPKELYF